MKNRSYNVVIRRASGNTFIEVVRAADYKEALQIEMQRVNPDEKILSAISINLRGETLWYGNFIVKRGKSGLFDVYSCTSRGEKIGKSITSADDLNKAIDKVKLLQRGYERCLASERKFFESR